MYFLMGVSEMKFVIVYNLGDGHLDPAEEEERGQSP